MVCSLYLFLLDSFYRYGAGKVTARICQQIYLIFLLAVITVFAGV